MGFDIKFYELKQPPKERLNEILNSLHMERDCHHIRRKIRAIEREIDAVKYVLVTPQPRLRISNLTYNYSQYQTYWYGRDDLHGHTVSEARERMLEAIMAMEKDGIISTKTNTCDTIGDLLWWLKSAHTDLHHIDDEFVIMLD